MSNKYEITVIIWRNDAAFDQLAMGQEAQVKDTGHAAIKFQQHGAAEGGLLLPEPSAGQ